jgi:hypothetical protein
MADLETVELTGVEIMAAGERVRGQNSPPDGEVYQTADLERLAKNTNEVLDLVQPWSEVETDPIGYQKVGHNPDQSFLKASGLYTDDGRPATGWLHNLRVEGDKLVSDIRDVPKKFADLIHAKAFRRRSTEILNHTSTVDGVKREIVGRLAWLGARRPAFQTLADVAALYADRAIDEDSVKIAVTDVEPVLQLPADSGRRMSDHDTNLKAFAEAVGLEGEPTAEQVLEKVKAALENGKAAESKVAELETARTEDTKQFSDRVASLEAETKQLREKDRIRERDAVIGGAIRAGRIPVSAQEAWEKRYDAAPDTIREVIAELPVNEDLVKVYGSDEDVSTPESQQAADDKAYAEYQKLVGIATAGGDS